MLRCLQAWEENGFISTAVMGAVAGHPLLAAHLEEVVSRFRGDDDKNFESSLEIITPRIYGAAASDSRIRVYAPEYFYPYNHQTGTISVTAETVAFHHFFKTWVAEAEFPDHLPLVAILIPTLGRPEGLERCLGSIDRLYYPKHLIRVVVDDGEGTVPVKVNRMYRKQLEPMPEAYIYAANDMEFDPWCVYRAVKASKDHGLVSFNAGEVYSDKGNICEHFLIRADIIATHAMGEEIFSEKFHHVGCDNLLWARCDRLGQAVWCQDARIIHYHFSKGAPMDEVYQRGWANADADRATLARELAKLDIPQMADASDLAAH